MIILIGGIVFVSILGQGEFKYRVIEDWAKLPDEWFLWMLQV